MLFKDVSYLQPYPTFVWKTISAILTKGIIKKTGKEHHEKPSYKIILYLNNGLEGDVIDNIYYI